MRVFAFLFCTVVFGLSPKASFSQDADIVIDKTGKISIKRMLHLIHEQSNYRFVYNNDLISGSPKVVLEKGTLKASQLLEQSLNPLNLSYEFTDDKTIYIKRRQDDLFLVKSSKKSELQFQISGKVTDANGEPLPGATIIEKGTTNGTQTDFDGNFSLTVGNTNATISISYIGFKAQEIQLNGQSSLDVVLKEDTANLDEVVVVGFGTQKKVNLTGAVFQVEGDRIADRPVTGTTESLQGVIPGVVVTRGSGSPGQEGYNIQIRGVTSVNGSNALVLIDGIEGDINSIRPEDIESISALKDAAAASIYGSKAAGGVILITTKKGKAGKVSVEYNSYTSIQKLDRMPSFLSSWEKAEFVNLARENRGQSPRASEEDIARMKDPNITWLVNPNNSNEYVYYGNYNYADLALYKNSILQSHNVSVSGGNENTTYRVSGTYYKNDGFIKIAPDNNERYNLTLNMNNKLGEKFELSNIIYYSTNNVEKPRRDGLEGRWGLFERIYAQSGAIPIYDPNGYPTEGNRSAAYGNENRLTWYAKEYGKSEWVNRNLRMNSSLTVKNIIKGLKVQFIGVLDQDFRNEFITAKEPGYYGIDETFLSPPQGGSLTKSNTTNRYREFQTLVNYDVDFNHHNIHLLGGYAFNDFRSEYFSAKASGLVNQNLPAFDFADVETTASLTDDIATNAVQSVFGRFNYNFKERYLFEANVRYDGSSRLAPENRYQLFPSVSLGWRLDNENWFDVPSISQVKFRGSWGQLGNADVLGNYGFIGLLSVGDDLMLGTDENADNYIYQGTLASNSVTWETIQTSNIGIDLGFFNNKLSLTGDYYVKRNKEMLAAIAYPSVIGVNTPRSNVGELKTWGWEANISWKDNIGKDFNYWINGNLADSQNELVEYYGATTVSPGVNQLIEGYPINSVFGYKTDGFFQTQAEVDNHAFQNNVTAAGDTKYLDLNGDDIINTGSQTLEDTGDMAYLGNTNPRYTYGIQAGFNWKWIDFSMFLQGVGKRSFMLDEAVYPSYFGARNPFGEHMDYWTEENTDALWPRPFFGSQHNFQVADMWIQDAAYIRLKDIQIGFSLSEKTLEKVGFQKVRVYFAGRDVWESTKTFDFIDPELQGGNTTYLYPFSRRYTLGINLTF